MKFKSIAYKVGNVNIDAGVGTKDESPRVYITIDGKRVVFTVAEAQAFHNAFCDLIAEAVNS